MKTISKGEYYHALCLYMLATRRQREVDELEKEMNDILGLEEQGHVSDAVYTYGNTGTEKEFRDALKREKVEVSNKA